MSNSPVITLGGSKFDEIGEVCSIWANCDCVSYEKFVVKCLPWKNMLNTPYLFWFSAFMSVLFWAKGRTVSTDAIYIRRKIEYFSELFDWSLINLFYFFWDRLISILVSTRESQEAVIFTIWHSCFFGQKLNSIKRKDIWLVKIFKREHQCCHGWHLTTNFS